MVTLVIAMILMTVIIVTNTVTNTAVQRHNPSDLRSSQLER